MGSQEQEPYVVSSKSYTAVAVNAAAKAGEWIKSRLGQFKSLTIKSSMHDIVTEVDKGAEVMIKKLIMTHFPDHDILGEESVAPGADAANNAINQLKSSEYLWIIDPVDGTTNFVHGFPYFSVSIALAHKGEVVVGVVYDPMRDELFVAEKGKGAYVHGLRMQVSAETELSGCLMATGFPTERERALPLNLKGMTAIAPQVRNIRNGGSAALHLAYVAAGRLDGFWELNLNAWDLAAGSLLVTESGGKITDTHGQPYQLCVRDMLATNGHIHDDVIHVLKEADAQG
ncbi:inositol monophosphatase family protein [Paenibacillus marinisediminis]